MFSISTHSEARCSEHFIANRINVGITSYFFYYALKVHTQYRLARFSYPNKKPEKSTYGRVHRADSHFTITCLHRSCRDSSQQL